MPALPPGLSLEPQYSLVRLRSSIHPWQQRVMREMPSKLGLEWTGLRLQHWLLHPPEPVRELPS